MAYSGYPTPDNPETQDYTCVSVYIPTSQDNVFMSVLLGQIGELTNSWFWKQDGTMSPEQAAYVWSVAMAMTNADGEACMNCDDVADCIENSQDVQAALSAYNQAVATGGASGGNNGNSTWSQPLPPSVMGAGIVPVDALCTEANKYAMSLAIVRALDKLVTDFLQIIEVITNPNEIAAEMVQGVPIFGGGASLALDTAAWLQDNIKEVYDAAYNPTTELDYACSVYCQFDACSLSYDDIIEAYQIQGSIAPPASNDFFTVMTWLIENVLPATDNLIVGAMHWFVLLCLRYGSNWFGSGVWTYMQIEIENAKDEEVTVPQSCGCAPPAPPVLKTGGVCYGIATGVLTDLGGGTYRVQGTNQGNNIFVAIFSEQNDALIEIINAAPTANTGDIQIQTGGANPCAVTFDGVAVGGAVGQQGNGFYFARAGSNFDVNITVGYV